MQKILHFDSLDQYFDKLDQNLLHSTILNAKSFAFRRLLIKIPWISLVSPWSGHAGPLPPASS
jgi:hypothetical protein